MTRIIDILDTFGGWLSKLLMLIAAVAMFSLVPMAGWLVFGRYVLNASPTWVEAASLVTIVVITFGVAAAAVREEQHLAINFIRESFPPRVEAVMKIASFALLAFFGVMMAVSARELIAFGWSRMMPLLNVPDGIKNIPLLVCGIAMTFFSLIHIARLVLTWGEIPHRRDEPPVSGIEIE
jgi:TRAP-type C4-dicarboxylate transport system permease small subunit